MIITMINCAYTRKVKMHCDLKNVNVISTPPKYIISMPSKVTSRIETDTLNKYTHGGILRNSNFVHSMVFWLCEN